MNRNDSDAVLKQDAVTDTLSTTQLSPVNALAGERPNQEISRQPKEKRKERARLLSEREWIMIQVCRLFTRETPSPGSVSIPSAAAMQTTQMIEDFLTIHRRILDIEAIIAGMVDISTLAKSPCVAAARTVPRMSCRPRTSTSPALLTGL